MPAPTPPPLLFENGTPAGRLMATPGARALPEDFLFRCIGRHLRGDDDNRDPEDRARNAMAYADPSGEHGRIFHTYGNQDDDQPGELRLWIITEADRSRTTCLLPSEY